MRRLLILLVLLFPASAPAATVTLNARGGEATSGETVFKAASGETNRVMVSDGKTNRTLFRDSANPVKARGRDCKQVDAHTASCEETDDLPKIDLGGGNDTYTNRSGVSPEVRGGTGNDVLRAGRVFSYLDGGPGDDVLRGGRAGDTLTGGPGRDRLYGGKKDDVFIEGESNGHRSRDLYDGGPSDEGDTIDYSKRSGDLRIDLAAGTTNTEDRLRGFENLKTGSGDDVLLGDDDENVLESGEGDDRVDGRAGDDIVSGDDGTDRVTGGAGNDLLYGGDGLDRFDAGAGDDQLTSGDGDETLVCGAGTDDVTSDPADTLVDCETAGDSEVVRANLDVLPAVTASQATFTAECFESSEAGCRGTVALTGPAGQAYGSAAFALSEGRGLPIVVPLTTALPPGVLVVTVTSTDGPNGTGRVTGYRVNRS